MCTPGCSSSGERIGHRRDDVDDQAFVGEHLREPVGASPCPRPRAARGSPRRAAAASRFASASESPTTGSNAPAARCGVVGTLGRGEHGTTPARVVREQPVERQRQPRQRRRRSVASHVVGERVGERGFLVEQVLRAVAQPAGLEQHDERGQDRAGRAAGASSGASHGSHDSMPSKVWPCSMRSHCAAPHGCSAMQRTPRARARRRSAAPRAPGRSSTASRSSRRALVGDRELAEPVDLVAPQVDAHRVVRGDGVDVDDRAPHRDLAARLDLVLAAVAERRRAGATNSSRSSRPPGRDGHRLDVGDVRTEPLDERAHRRDDDERTAGVTGRALRAQAPEHPHAPAHRLERRRHPLERQRLPRREQLDRVGTEQLAEVVRDALGLGRGRRGDEDRCGAAGDARERGEEQRARRVADRDRVARSAARARAPRARRRAARRRPRAARSRMRCARCARHTARVL